MPILLAGSQYPTEQGVVSKGYVLVLASSQLIGYQLSGDFVLPFIHIFGELGKININSF